MLPYFIMLAVCGIPLLLMEMAIGQYTRRGPVEALLNLCPLFVGSGIGVVVISVLFVSYYNTIIAWALYYLAASVRSPLPWTQCPNATLCPEGTALTQIYYDTQVLQRSAGLEQFGSPVWPLLGAVLLAWLAVYFAIFRSVKSSGSVVLVTATLPYAVILVFLVRAVTLDGAGTGLELLFRPQWHRLADITVWVSAAAQNFNSIGIGFGSMITFSSYNKFSNNLHTDVWLVGLVNAATSLLAGVIVFSAMGNIAHESGRDIQDIVDQGPGLAFVVYPQAIAHMPYPNLFAALFFSLLVFLGIDSQFASVEVIVTAAKDAFPRGVQRLFGRHEYLVAAICLACFLLGLPNIFQGGIYYFTLVDHYSAAISLLFLAFFEVAAVVWCYGAQRLAWNVKEMTGRMPSRYFVVCWRVLAPCLILVILSVALVQHVPPSLSHYTFPAWSEGLGWAMAACSILPIPVGALLVWGRQGGGVWERLVAALRPRLLMCAVCHRSEHAPAPCCCQVSTPLETKPPLSNGASAGSRV